MPQRIRVVVWNALKGHRDGWSDRFHQLTAGRQLALLQEAWIEPGSGGMGADFVASHLAWKVVVSWVARGGERTGVATGSVASPACLVPMRSVDLESMIRTPKTALATCYAIEGSDTTLLVLNIHAVNAVGLQAQQRQLDSLEAVISSHDGPILLGGDFNTQTESKLTQVRSLATRTRLEEVVLDERAGERSRVRGRPLDHTFVRGLTVHSATVVSVEESDHNPLLLDLEVQGSP